MKNNAVFNSTLIYISTALLTLVIHEAGHFIVESIWHFDAIMHPNYGSYSGFASDFQKIVIAAAGPLTSLLQGVVFFAVIIYKREKDIFSLIALWLSLHGFVLFFGYLISAPFFIYGDTGQVFYMMKMPLINKVVISILSVFALLRILNALSNEFQWYGAEIRNAAVRAKKLILFPILSGGIAVILLQLPLPNFLLIFASISTPLIFLIVYQKVKEKTTASPVVILEKLYVAVVILSVLTVTLVRILI